jgi:hypothetical protein
MYTNNKTKKTVDYHAIHSLWLGLEVIGERKPKRGRDPLIGADEYRRIHGSRASPRITRILLVYCLPGRLGS